MVDNCEDTTYQEMLKVKADRICYTRYYHYRPEGDYGKAGVLNDALKNGEGEYICVYDADAMPEKMLFIFWLRKF